MSWNEAADLATVFGVAVAVGALLVGWGQLAAAKRIAQNTYALETHREYLKLCIERPELSSSTAMLAHLKRDSFDNIAAGQHNDEAERCQWFISYVLHTMEQILEATTHKGIVDPHWEAVVRSQISFHAGLIEVIWSGMREHYGHAFQSVVDEVIALREDVAAPLQRGHSAPPSE